MVFLNSDSEVSTTSPQLIPSNDILVKQQSAEENIRLSETLKR